MGLPLRVLLVEDSPDDAALVLNELRHGGFDPTYERVEDAVSMAAALERGGWDVVISDHNLPRFSGPAALAMVKARGLDLPLVLVSGSIGEERAVDVMKAGAADFVMKDRLVRLPVAVTRELREAVLRRRFRELARRREDLLRTLSHEVRTPVTAIRSCVEILAGHAEERPEGAEFLRIIESETGRLDELVEDLLVLLSARERDPSAAAREPFSLARLFEEAVRDLQQDGCASGGRIELLLPALLPPVSVDRAQGRRVAFRLLKLAARVTPAEGRVLVRAESDGFDVVCRISVGGAGVPVSERERVFEPFGLDPDSPSDLPKGSGLVLPVCRQIVESMGGWLALDDEPEGGCALVLTLRAAQPTAEADPLETVGVADRAPGFNASRAV